MEYSVGDEKSFLVFVSQRINAVSQGQERTINLGPFHQPEASVLGDCPSLGTCQVDKRKLSNDAFNFNILCLACLGDADLENCMTTRRGEVGIVASVVLLLLPMSSKFMTCSVDSALNSVTPDMTIPFSGSSLS